MKNITYFLGAGASCKSIPAMTELNSAIMNCVQRLSSLFKSEEKIYNHINSTWIPLLNLAIQHPSIDTYAKKLYLTNEHHTLWQLKLILSAYFLHEQSSESETDNFYQYSTGVRYSKLPVDPRYDFFMAALLKPSELRPVLPDNLYIVSWNYDSQLEMAYHPYSKIDQNDDKSLRQYLRIFPLIENEYDRVDTDNMDKYHIVKLNGTASSVYTERKNSYELQSYRKLFFRETIHEIKSILVTALNFLKTDEYLGYGSNVNFAWELQQNWFSEMAVEAAKEIISKSSTLVVIGYSFPVFNRDIDKYIFEGNMLEKIYIQDLPASIEGVRSRASKIMDVDEDIFELETSVDQFLIPFEL